jgi:C-terminal processing protease CtpA/Prc
MKRWLVLATALAICSLSLADEVKHPTPEFLALPVAERNLAVYDAFWDALEANYYDPKIIASKEWRKLREEWREYAASDVPSSNLYGQLLNEIAAKLPDSHVGAELPPRPAKPPAEKYSAERMKRLNTLLAFGPGYYGTAVRRGRGTYGLVTEVMPDTPAEAAGIRPGWRIVRAISTLAIDADKVRFNGEFIPLEGASAQAWESGALQPVLADQWRILKISFDHRPIRVPPPVEHRRLGTDISYLRFDAFGDDEFMKPVFQALDEAGPAGLILDLRWNGGGFTHQLQRLAGVLLADGVLLGTLQNSKGIEPMTANAAAKRYAGPLVLIIGPSTGSSSEILAAAVRDYKRGRLVGRMTNGSSLVSQGFPLPDGGVARVPITDFRTSTEQRIEGVGVVPDIRVMSTLEDARAGRDPAVERALSLLQATN